MKVRRFGVVLFGVAVLTVCSSAWATSATWDVATVNGTEQFTISPDGTTLTYAKQGWTNYVWYENNGKPPGTIAQGPYGNRTGMRTFAMTDVAVGRTLSEIKLAFDYNNSMGGYPTINFFVTDGAGHFGIFAPTSLGIGSVAVISTVDSTWNHMAIDLTSSSISDLTNVAVYEHNGLDASITLPFTTMQWGDVKDLTIAGPYDYQRSPSNGWSAWGSMFSELNVAGEPTVVNGFGLALIWGDTANSNNSYGSREREIRNVTVSFGGSSYAADFVNATVPEPMTMLAVFGGVSMLGGYIRRRRAA